LISSPSELIIIGDFNLHVDNRNCPFGTSFLTLLETFGLSQLVSFPTHDSGHPLYLLITRTTSNIFTDVTFTCPALSDHSAIMSVFSIPSRSRSPRITKLIRNIKSIINTAFSNDIFSSALYTAPFSSLNACILQFFSTLSLLLDKHAPLKTVTCPSQQRKPFITDDILKEKTKRSKLKTIYQRTNT